MTPFSLGFWLLYRTSLFDAEHADAVARLLTDPRWPWQPSLVRPTHRPGQEVYDWPKGRVPASELRATVRDIMRSERAQGIHLASSRQDHANHAWVIVDSGQHEAAHEAVAYPLVACGICRTHVPAGRSVDEWLSVVRELASVVDAVHGVIWAGVDERPILSRQFLIGRHQPKLPPDHPHNESARLLSHRRVLGERYVRISGWAVFLRRAHLEQIGGLAALRAYVQPAIVEPLGELVYLQLSSLADALEPETEARRLALAELMKPIIVPV